MAGVVVAKARWNTELLDVPAILREANMYQDSKEDAFDDFTDWGFTGSGIVEVTPLD